MSRKSVIIKKLNLNCKCDYFEEFSKMDVLDVLNVTDMMNAIVEIESKTCQETYLMTKINDIFLSRKRKREDDDENLVWKR